MAHEKVIAHLRRSMEDVASEPYEQEIARLQEQIAALQRKIAERDARFAYVLDAIAWLEQDVGP